MNTNAKTDVSPQDIVSVNPATGKPIWRGTVSTPQAVNTSVRQAYAAFDSWSRLLLQERVKYVQNFIEKLNVHKNVFAELISQETGKPRWEALAEVAAMLGKGPISIVAYNDRCGETRKSLPNGESVTRFKPLGVVGVLGPFNLPGHLPNGHIIPALLAGNTVVFKPSELTPAVGEHLVQLWKEAGLPDHVVNVVQGDGTVGAALAEHPLLAGLYFTGSYETGRKLHALFGGHPEKMLALEMGGNNPLVVYQVRDLEAAAYATIQSAYITAGQRCVCARRLIVPAGREGDAFVECLVRQIKKIRYGIPGKMRACFMGTMISPEAADRVIEAQDRLVRQGGYPIVTCLQGGDVPALLSPGLMDCTAIPDRADEEIFGPLLQLIRVKDFDAAIAEANNTAFGLSAGLLSDVEANYKNFRERVRAGVVNWNQQITGASSAAPFGGVGLSGNHRPSAYFAADYCAYPIASIEQSSLKLPETLTPGIELNK